MADFVALVSGARSIYFVVLESGQLQEAVADADRGFGQCESELVRRWKFVEGR